ncbi:T9SS type A sorting domain-containing protein [Urechidicola croceus]|uniref:Secretion system C-terminal sorting domain-containing protein n=1 Tax=Urechidicola croceus TaxID=1850246 RepID=A0A1D8P8C3_9FLAO|nr:T9SS type A sorting domain-containing protein [Urechidicola croceus]AOW20823.1 hypothetical protein LPB138_09100 [Urechidicola croceus]
MKKITLASVFSFIYLIAFSQEPTTFTSTIIPDLSMYGESISYPGTGEYQIFLGSDNELNKPVIITDGFDPRDTWGTNTIYNQLSFDNAGTQTNFADMLRAEGFDIVILNFPVYTRTEDGMEIDGGTDFIERNAMLLVELINIINTQKIGDEQNVIVGPSMGGLISRYALNYMESESLEHDTRLWVSFDAPHHGVNAPIGLQHLFNFLAFGLDFGFLGNYSIESLQPLVEGMFKSSAGRQMLTDQFEPHLMAGSEVNFDPSITLPINHPYFTTFYTNLKSLTTTGFPGNPRKISLINGSGIGNPYLDINGIDIVPGREILNTTIEDVGGLTDITLKANFSPYSSQEIAVSSIQINILGSTTTANSQAFSYSDGIGASPGGLFNIGAFTEGLDNSDPIVSEFINSLQIDKFSFVPTVSSMALEITDNEVNWFHAPTNLISANETRGVNDTTPFDAWLMPDDNQTHTLLTSEGANFLWEEIVSASLKTDEFSLNNSFAVLGNPVKNQIRIQINDRSIKNISTKIYSITGLELFTNKFNTLSSNQIEIPINLNSGIYILELIHKNEVFKTKIIVE